MPGSLKYQSDVQSSVRSIRHSLNEYDVVICVTKIPVPGIRTQNVFDATSNKHKIHSESKEHLLTPILLEVEKYTFSIIMMNACYRNVLAVLVVAVTTPAIWTTSAFKSSSQFLGSNPRYFNTRARGGNSDTTRA